MPIWKKREEVNLDRVLYIPVKELRHNPSQPRRTFDEEGLRELAGSIRQHGVLQPLSVRQRGEGGWELIAGERRLRAAQMAGLEAVPCLQVDVGEEESALLALVENLQRRDLNFLEEAMALERLISTFGLSQEEAAARVGKSQPAVANKLRLLKLPENVLLRLAENGLTERHARALLVLEEERQQMEVLDYILLHSLNVAQTDAHVAKLLSQKASPARRVTFILKDIRVFLNTVARGLTIMQAAGVEAECGRTETEDAILLSIRIPKETDSRRPAVRRETVYPMG